jgi:hypothetical protein
VTALDGFGGLRKGRSRKASGAGEVRSGDFLTDLITAVETFLWGVTALRLEGSSRGIFPVLEPFPWETTMHRKHPVAVLTAALRGVAAGILSLASRRMRGVALGLAVVGISMGFAPVAAAAACAANVVCNVGPYGACGPAGCCAPGLTCESVGPVVCCNACGGANPCHGACTNTGAACGVGHPACCSGLACGPLNTCVSDVRGCCTGAKDCKAGLTCAGGDCLIPDNSAIVCKSDMDCLNSDCDNGVCEPKNAKCSAINGACCDNLDCCANLACTAAGSCLKANGQQCKLDTECAGGDCDGTCKTAVCAGSGTGCSDNADCCSPDTCGCNTLNCVGSSTCCLPPQTAGCTQASDCCGPNVTQCRFVVASNANLCCNYVNGQCHADSDCCDDNHCQPSSNLCKIDTGEIYCLVNGDCLSGNCVGGTCKCDGTKGGQCLTNADCCSNVPTCTNGTCG